MKIFQVDAFTHTPFGGNPAGVCVLEQAADEQWMQSVANEMNLAETAFAWPEEEGYRLRWFSPAVEVQLCGHATLATAYVLWWQKHLSQNQAARFYTRSGELVCRKGPEDFIAMDFPAIPVAVREAVKGLEEALGQSPRAVAEHANGYLLVELASEKALRNLQPDMEKLRGLGGYLVMVTAPSDDPAYDFVSRVFAPAFGIAEDYVTGSAHCALGPYWKAKLGKSALTARQVSIREGVLKLDVGVEQVRLMGQAVPVMEAYLL